MLEIRDLRDWLAKSTRGPVLMSVILGTLIVGEAARAALLLLGSRMEDDRSAQATHAPKRARNGIDVNAIIAAHLFGVHEDDSDSQDPARAPLSAANLVLTGTITMGDPKQGVAIVSDTGLSRVYSVGDTVGEVFLHSIYRDYVILDRSGRLEKLLLPRLPPASDSAALRPIPTPGPAAAPGTHRATGEAPRNLADVMRAGASVSNESGKLRGFRVYSSGDRAAFNATGLHNGDLVIAINGASLQDQDLQLGQEVFDSIKTLAYATLTVDGFGKIRDVTVDMSQVGANDSRDASAAPSTAQPRPSDP
jgi:type II secretion system protein C